MKQQSTETIDIPFLSQVLSSEKDARARRITYDNGYTLVMVPKPGDTFNVSTWVRTGSIHEDANISGISHFLEHLMFKGTKRFKMGEFDRAMESMGAIINAATWKDFTFYYVTGPRGAVQGSEMGENFAKALDMHADMMLGATIPDDEVGPPYDALDPDYQGEKRERSVVIEEISMREDQPWTKVYNAVNHMMYPDGHPYQRDVIGTRDIIGRVPRDTIYEYYRKWYSPANLTTIVVGDFDLAALESEVLNAFDFKKFGLAQNGASPVKALPDIRHDEGARYREVRADYQTTFFIMAYHCPPPSQLEETIALDIVSLVLGESRSSRLTQALLEKPEKPLFNYLSTDQTQFKLGNVFFIQGNLNTSDTQLALAQVTDQVNRLLTTEPITQAEFERALKSLRVDFAVTSETASGMAEAIGEALTVTDSLDSYIHYMSVLNGLTLDTVNAAARRYLSPDLAYTAVLLPEQEAKA